MHVGVGVVLASDDQPYLGWLGVVPGVGASLFANVESGITYGWLAAVWAGVPAAAFALAMFMLERWLTTQTAAGGTSNALWAPVPNCAEAAAIASYRATLAAGNPWSGRQLKHGLGCLVLRHPKCASWR